jgi:hypothetical protein
MATYYVRNDGSDANTGLGPGRLQAWQTIQKALGSAGISSGDTVYIAPGRYNETITINMISATVETRVLGDPTCTQFTDITPGVVRVVGTTADVGFNSAGTAITATSKNFLTFRMLAFEGYLTGFTVTTCTNWTIDDCVFTCRENIGTFTTPNNVAGNFVFTNNITNIKGHQGSQRNVNIQHSGTVALDHGTIVANNYFGGGGGNGGGGIAINGYTPGNALVFNNQFERCCFAVEVYSVTDTTFPVKAYNNLVMYPIGRPFISNIAGGGYSNYNCASMMTDANMVTNFTQGGQDRIISPTKSYGMERLFGLGVNDWYAPRLGSNLISTGDPVSVLVGITASSAEIPQGGNVYIVGDKVQFLTTLGNITALQTYTVATVTSTTSFTCTGLTPSTAGTIQHRRFRYTTDAFGTAYSPTSAPTIGMANRVDLSTIGQYIPTEKQVTTYRTTPGSQSQTTYVFLGVTGISFNTPNLVCYYVRNNSATVTVPLVTQTPTGAWVSGGFCEVDAVKLPGLYRFDIPNAMIATGTTSASFAIKGASGSNGAYVTVEFDQASMLISTPGYKLISDQLGANGELDIVQGTQTTVKLQIVDTYNTAVPVGAATCTVEAYSAGNLISTYTPTVQYDANGEMTFVLDSVVTANPAEYKLYVRRNNGGSDTTIHGPMIVRVKRK